MPVSVTSLSAANPLTAIAVIAANRLRSRVVFMGRCERVNSFSTSWQLVKQEGGRHDPVKQETRKPGTESIDARPTRTTSGSWLPGFLLPVSADLSCVTRIY